MKNNTYCVALKDKATKVWHFFLWVFLSSRQELCLVRTKSGWRGPKFDAGGIAPLMNACYLAMDPFIDVINIRSRLEGGE